MPITEAYLAARRTEIALLPELTAFRTAYALFDAAAHNLKARNWWLTFGDEQAGKSPAFRLRQQIRGLVTASARGNISPEEVETAYRTLVNEYAPCVPQPRNALDEAATLHDAIIEELRS